MQDLPRLSHHFPEQRWRERLAPVAGLMHAALEIKPRRNIEQKCCCGLGIIPRVLELFFRRSGHFYETVTDDSLEKDAGCLGKIHGIASLGPRHVAHYPGMKRMPCVHMPTVTLRQAVDIMHMQKTQPSMQCIGVKCDAGRATHRARGTQKATKFVRQCRHMLEAAGVGRQIDAGVA